MFTRTSRAKRRIGAAVLAALVGSLLAFASPANATGTAAAATDRLSGANRYATAADVALDPAWGNGAVSLTIVNGENFPDGLAAAARGNRILLVTKDSIPAETKAALEAMKTTATPAGPGFAANGVEIVGGTGVVSSAVKEELATITGVEPLRLAGADRYATALAVAVKEDADASEGLVVATGTNFPDALAAGPLAAKLNMGIVLTSGGSLSAAVKAHAAQVPVTKTIYIVGGTGVVPQSIEDELNAMGKNVKRLAGADRDATAVAVAAARATTGDNSAVLVNRNGFADALAAGPFAALTGVSGSIMLVGQDSIPAATAQWHADNCLTLGVTAANAGETAANAKVYAIGGTGVISDAVQTGAVAATKCAAVTYTATVANSNIVQGTTQIIQAEGGPQAGKGITLTAVPGSAADALGANAYEFTITDAGNAQTPCATAYSTPNAGKTMITLTVDIVAGTTQKTVADCWNNSQAASLFTATPTDPSVAGYVNFRDTPDPDGNGDGKAAPITAAAPTNGAMTQTVVVTFNQVVRNSNNATTGTVLDYADFTLVATGAQAPDAPATFAPAAGSALGTTYTMVFAGQTNPAKILTAGSSTIAIGAGKVFSHATNLEPAAAAQKFTAG